MLKKKKVVEGLWKQNLWKEISICHWLFCKGNSRIYEDCGICGKVCSASAKMTPHGHTFAITWKQSAPESEKLRWVNNGYKLNGQSGYENPRRPLGSSQLPDNLHVWAFAFLHSPQCIEDDSNYEQAFVGRLLQNSKNHLPAMSDFSGP